MKTSRKLWQFYAWESSLCSILNSPMHGEDGFDLDLPWVRILKRGLGTDILNKTELRTF